jgi:hypothetical protein
LSIPIFYTKTVLTVYANLVFSSLQANEPRRTSPTRQDETMTRQTNRSEARAAAKEALTLAKEQARTVAKRAILERQSARENAGAYTGRSVGASIAPSRSRVTKRTVKKGKEFGRILRSYTFDGREFSLHATKGWRSHAA